MLVYAERNLDRVAQPLARTWIHQKIVHQYGMLTCRPCSFRLLFYHHRLDILVYADMNSEPVTHFLGYSRLARVQAVFWGNPITTGKI